MKLNGWEVQWFCFYYPHLNFERVIIELLLPRENMHEQSQNLICKLDACKINSNLLNTGLTLFFCARKDINYIYA